MKMKHVTQMTTVAMLAAALAAPGAAADPIDDAQEAADEAFFCTLYGYGDNCSNPCPPLNEDQCDPEETARSTYNATRDTLCHEITSTCGVPPDLPP